MSARQRGREGERGPAPKRPIGRRHRRLRRTIRLVGLIALLAVVAGAVIYLATRPRVRRPGEELPEITRKLAQSLPAEAPMPRFTDVTEEAGLAGFDSFNGARTSQLPEDMGSGAAWGDFDGDGDDDLMAVSAGGSLEMGPEEWSPSRLYENLGDGTFRESAALPETRITGMAAAWGDYDGDGRLDLLVTGYNELRLYRNDGSRLVPDPALPALPGYWSGAAWGDFDNDRDLDLYVCGYVQYAVAGEGPTRASEQYGKTVPYTLNPASFEPERNLLFENLGDGRFREMAALLGVSNPEGRSLGALWHDFDDDGRLDLYVANDISDNALFLNRGDTFEDAGLEAWVADYRGAMGLAAGDWNRDGDDDLFVTHWIAQENALYDSRLRSAAPAPGSGPSPPRPARLTFADLASPLGLGQIALQAVGWGTEFADLDGDGWLDLVVANGSTLESHDDPPVLEPQPAMLLWNRRGEYFHDLAPLDPALSTPRVSRGLALSDYDLDGDLDILLVQLDGGVQLLRNEMQQGNWLALRLRSRGPRNGELTGRGEGAAVRLVLPDVELRRAVTGASYLSQSSRTLHFGLGEADAIAAVIVRWPGAAEERFTGLEVNGIWELREGDPAPRRVAGVDAEAARERLVEFWTTQRAAMDAMKVDGDYPRAIELFRRALALDPAHQDSRYYLANLLAARGDTAEALAELDRIREADPMSHRAYKQWGVLRALTAESEADLAAAEKSLQRSVEINREETGSLLVLAEIDLVRGRREQARQRLEWVTQTNPRAGAAFFLRAYLRWTEGEEGSAAELLRQAAATRGEDWKPAGAAAEGDVAGKMHREVTLLSAFWEGWDGAAEAPDEVFSKLRTRLEG